MATASSSSGLGEGSGATAALLTTRRRGLPELKVVLCVLLAFGNRPVLEADYQRQRALKRARFDVIRALLRLISWIGFAGKGLAASSATAGDAARMVLLGAAQSLAPVLVLLFTPASFLRWRCVLVGAWNLAHAFMVCAFYPQLYPPGGSPPASLVGSLAYLLWHSQAFVMLLNCGGPLVVTFRYLLHSQLMIFMLYLRRNPRHCAVNPKLQAAAAAVHGRLTLAALRRVLRSMLPLLRSLLPTSALRHLARQADHAGSAPAVTLQLCSLYVPLLQLFVGLLLPCMLAYRTERCQRRAFLQQRGLRPEYVLLHRELGMALLAAALQLATMLSVPQQG